MPTKNKKEKKVIKQKQKQTQKQVVNIKIGDVKRAAVRRKGNKKPIVKQSVQYMYQATGAGTTQPQPQIPKAAYETIGVAQPARQNILSPLSSQIQQVLNETENIPNEPPLQIGKGAETRPSLFGGDKEVDIEYDFAEPVSYGSVGSVGSRTSQTESAREVRRAMQISEGRGGDVPLEFLLLGMYQNEGQTKRRFPTIIQRQRLLEAGYPIAGDEDGVVASPKPSPKKKKDT